jgi:phosphopantothenoylcysteine decarboxylase/phosphopantothenate--cysteine ligase
MNPERNILFMMSGSIACAKATGLISEWTRKGHAVRVACTPSVENFVGYATLEGLSGSPVFSDAFESGRAMDHIALAQWADVLVVCPATSNLINKLGTGIADEAVSTLWQAAWGRGIPQFLVPAMNTRMWNYPATREHVAKLQSWGVHVLPTAAGDLACGEHGEGRMLEVSEIRSRIERLLEFPEARQAHRILITGGGTREPIDSVRYIGNHSTGRTAAALADRLAAAGHTVTWLGARSAIQPGPDVERVQYEQFGDLDRQLKRLLGAEAFDMVVHAAAVSDFSVASVQGAGSEPGAGRKLASSGELELRLKPNPKLLSRIRGYSSNPDLLVVGFKLTVGADDEQAAMAIDKLFQAARADAVVHNDFEQISDHLHEFTLHRRDHEPRHFSDHGELALGLGEILED